MKTDSAGEPAVARASSAPVADVSRKRRLRGVVIVLALLAVVLGAGVAGRHALARYVITQAVAATSGYRVKIGSFALGRVGSEFHDVALATPSGEPLLEIERIAVRYDLHEAVWGNAHRYGLLDVELDAPVLTLVQHADGSYNLPAGAASPSAGGRAGAGTRAPLRFRARIRRGAIRLIDEDISVADLIQQQITGVTFDARIASDRRSDGTGRATLIGRRAQGAPLQRWPLTFGGFADVSRGVAIGRARAQAVPLRGLATFIQQSSTVRVEDGVLADVDLKLFSLRLGTPGAPDLHVGGGARLESARLRFAGLARPVRDLHGRLTLVDDGVWSQALHGTLAGLGVDGRGGAFGVHRPILRLGLTATGDLHDLRGLLAFAQAQPLRGRAHVETLLEAPAAALLVRTALRVEHGSYAAIPLTDLAGRVDYHAGTVVLDGVHARYGAARLAVGGRFLLGRDALDSAIALAAAAPGRLLPYAQNVAPEARIDALTVITGGRGYRAGGTISAAGNGVDGAGTFRVDERGVGEFGPFAFRRTDGSTLAGALRLERPSSRSAAWLTARHYRIDVPPSPARLAGLATPAFPPLGGIYDGALIGGGSPTAFSLRGTLRGDALRVGSLRLGRGQATLGGRLGDVRLAGIALAGPLGGFDGTGATGAAGLALRGRYAGSLEQLAPLTGLPDARGGLAGPVAALFGIRSTVVQSTGALVHGGTVRGVRVDAASGTLAVRAGLVHVVAADGLIAGRHAVAAESNGTIALSAPDVPAAALRGTGLPLEAGAVSAFGVADLRARNPRFEGMVTVANGRAGGYAVAGDARVRIDGPLSRIIGGTAALGSTYGTFSGSLGQSAAHGVSYDVDTHVGTGDVDVLRHDVHAGLPAVAGSFAADLHLGGNSARPVLSGTMAVPEGNYHGLAFRDAAGHVTIGRTGLAAAGASIVVGTTRAMLAASRSGGAFAFMLRSPAVDLADFNDYFDSGDALAGRGSVTARIATDGRSVVTSGALDLRDLRYAAWPFGAASATWSTTRGTVAMTAATSGPAGALRGRVSVVPAHGDPTAVRRAHYSGEATLHNVDLATWLPALGFTTPASGRLDAGVSVAGRFPALDVQLEGRIPEATVAGFAVRNARMRASASGSRIHVMASHADTPFAAVDGSGTLGLRPDDPLAFDLRVQTGDIAGAARAFVPAARALDIGGALAADVQVGGTVRKPKVAGGFELTGARYSALAVPRTIGSLALEGNAIELRDVDVDFVHGQAFVAGSLPLLIQPFGLGPATAPLSVDVTVRGVDLGQFASLLPAKTTLGGSVDGRFGVEGSVAQPRLFGGLAIAGGSYRSNFERAPIQNVAARLRFAGSSVALDTFHAGVGTGTLDGSGRISLPFGAQPRSAYRLDLTAKGAQLDFPAYGHGTVDGDLLLTGADRRPMLAGNLALRDAVVPVGAVYGASGPGARGSAGPAAIDPALTIHAAVGRNVRLRSSIVDIGVAGAVDVSGTLTAPRLAGGFSATDGTVSSYNHLFRVVNAAVSFDPADGIVPTVDARAVARVTNPDPDPSRNVAGSANITVAVSGQAQGNDLVVTYSSDPAYSQEQIVGLLLDVPALLGAVNFNLNAGQAGALRGAPGETNVLLPPGITPQQVNPVTINQEVFSLLNGQLTQRALTPVERVFEKVFGLSEIEFTVDYGGGIGYSLRRQIGKRDFYSFLSQTVTYPGRLNAGFELVPQPFASVVASYYHQDGITSLITNQTPGLPLLNSARRLTSVQPLGNRDGFSITYSRRYP